MWPVLFTLGRPKINIEKNDMFNLGITTPQLVLLQNSGGNSCSAQSLSVQLPSTALASQAAQLYLEGLEPVELGPFALGRQGSRRSSLSHHQF